MSEEAKTAEKPKTPELYVGAKKVKNVAINEDANLVGVLFEDETERNYTIAQWQAVQSAKPYNEGDVSLRKFSKLMQTIIQALMDEHCTITDYSFVLTRVEETIKQNYLKAVAQQFGFNFVEQIPIQVIHEALIAHSNSAEAPAQSEAAAEDETPEDGE